MAQLNIIMAQINPLVGDIHGNTELIIKRIQTAQELYAPDVIVFPELTLTGYPPEDLLLRPSIKTRIDNALQTLKTAMLDVYVVVGYPMLSDDQLFNMAGVIYRGEIIAQYAKQKLPNYRVFDEVRYFAPGTTATVIEIKGVKVGLSICEDIWYAEPMELCKNSGAELMINLNASPFHVEKLQERKAQLATRALQGNMPIIYVNQVGGQDELVFDGNSMAVNRQGEVVALSPAFEEHLHLVKVDVSTHAGIEKQEMSAELSLLPSVYQALVVGVRDYVNKNRFKGVVLGLSGGIDSGLTLAIAVDALGKERVEAVMMPFRYTSQMSEDDAYAQSKLLDVAYSSLSIEPMYEAFMATLEAEFAGLKKDTTEENLQARCRGVLLMAISNKKGFLVLTTGNKSEMAVGYSTLYGDMAGGFDVLKDVPKTLVFELAKYRNTISPAIPPRVIDRPPSAELAPDQKDEDSLPPYVVLDKILYLYVEQDYSADAIIAEGFAADMVRRVIRMVDLNEYKRRQAPVGVRITGRGFGRDRRYPITSGWKVGE